MFIKKSFQCREGGSFMVLGISFPEHVKPVKGKGSRWFFMDWIHRRLLSKTGRPKQLCVYIAHIYTCNIFQCYHHIINQNSATVNFFHGSGDCYVLSAAVIPVIMLI